MQINEQTYFPMIGTALGASMRPAGIAVIRARRALGGVVKKGFRL
jgi:hypothetical protein